MCSRACLRLKPVGLERPDVDVRRPAGHQVGDYSARDGGARESEVTVAKGVNTGPGGIFEDTPLVIEIPFTTGNVDVIALVSADQSVEVLETEEDGDILRAELTHLSYVVTMKNAAPSYDSAKAVEALEEIGATVSESGPVALEVMAGDEDQLLDLSRVFSDSDLTIGDQLSYQISVENSALLSVSESETEVGKLVLDFIDDKSQEGTTEVTIQSTDTNGVQAVDQNGNDTLSFFVQVNSITPDHWEIDIDLQYGLNLVSLPLQPIDENGEVEQWTASDIADKTGATVIVAYDSNQGDNGEFIPFIPQVMKDEAGNYVDHGFAIQAGQSYILNVLETGSLPLQGQPWGQLVNTEEGQQSVDSGTGPAAPPNNGTANAAPDSGSDPWTFVISGDLALDPALSFGFDQAAAQIIAVNHQTGKQLSGRIQGSRFYFVLADLSMRPVVAEGQTFEIRAEDKDANLIAGPVTWQLDARHLRQAYLHQQLTIGDVIPNQTQLLPNYPNPFNPETWIPFELEQGAGVSMMISDNRGNTVRQLNLGYKEAGRYLSKHRAAYWNGRNTLGEPVGSGIYFYTFIAGSTEPLTQTRKMVILK